MEKKNVMYLNARVSMSPYNEKYNMAYMYCYDESKRYCFSLSRFPEGEEIEVMVLDQVNLKVDDLSVEFDSRQLVVQLEKNVADRLDGHDQYIIDVVLTEDEDLILRETLYKIFSGKKGLDVKV